MTRVTILKGRLHFRGGLEKYTLRLAQAFAGSGCNVTILTTDAPPPLQNIETVSLMKSSKLSFHNISQFDTLCQKWLATHPQEIIFGMERTSYQTHYRAGSGVHKHYMKQRSLTDGSIRQALLSINPLHRKILALEKKAFEDPRLKILFTNSYMVRNEILEYYRTPPEKIQVVHNGVEYADCEADFNNTFNKKRTTPFHFLFVGNGYKRKGLLFLLRGLAQLSAEDFQLTVVGKEKNIPFYQNVAHQLGLSKRVFFRGPQTNLCPFYQEADSLVIPSIYDPFSNVTLEALAMGLFVVSSKYNGGSEVLSEKTGAIIENLAEAESMAEALKKAFTSPKTFENAQFIRHSIKELDFSNQLSKIVQKTLQTNT